ncbi:mCG9345, isoform CRA_e [Mus musculus]|nr:mCG9345, isoform CRA_e [Mus musculus]
MVQIVISRLLAQILGQMCPWNMPLKSL